MKKQNKQTDTFKKITIAFGYSLFFLLLIAVLVSIVIPMSQYFFNPVASHFNIAILIVTLVAGTLLPLLVSYIIGDRVTHSKSKVDHHFNGVLFGIASYWLSTFFGFIGSEAVANIRTVVSEPLASVIVSWPILATLIVMAVVAVSYAKSKKIQSSVLEYRPYQLVQFTGLIATFAYTLVSLNINSNAEWAVSMLYVAVPAALIAISYILLPKKKYSSSIARLTTAVVATTFGVIAASVAAQLTPFQIDNGIFPLVVGLAVLVFYILLIRRTK